MTTLTVKIPSPSVEKIKALVFDNNLEMPDILEQFMTLVVNSLKESGDTELVFNEVVMTNNAIEAKITLASLPRYQTMKTRYQAINFEAELIKRINQARAVYDDNCPEPDGLLLSQSIVTWHHRWVTAYIWVLICVVDHDDVFPLDKDIIDLLLARIEHAAIY